MDPIALSPETLCAGAFAACLLSPRRLATRLGGAGALALPVGAGLGSADAGPGLALALMALMLAGGGGAMGLAVRLVLPRLFPGLGPLFLLRSALSVSGLLVLLAASGAVGTAPAGPATAGPAPGAFVSLRPMPRPISP